MALFGEGELLPLSDSLMPHRLAHRPRRSRRQALGLITSVVAHGNHYNDEVVGKTAADVANLLAVRGVDLSSLAEELRDPHPAVRVPFYENALSSTWTTDGNANVGAHNWIHERLPAG